LEGGCNIKRGGERSFKKYLIKKNSNEMERSCNVKKGNERRFKKRFGEKKFTLRRWKGVTS
jgi:hypothetical protein